MRFTTRFCYRYFFDSLQLRQLQTYLQQRQFVLSDYASQKIAALLFDLSCRNAAPRFQTGTLNCTVHEPISFR